MCVVCVFIVCVCVCLCICAFVPACVRACVHVCVRDLWMYVCAGAKGGWSGVLALEQGCNQTKFNNIQQNAPSRC